MTQPPDPTPPPWVPPASLLPLGFAQVKEDPALDLCAVALLPAQARVCMIASGGCTAAILAVHPRIADLQLVDANPAQIALSRLKLRLLEEAPPQRLPLLGHSPMLEEARSAALLTHLQALDLPGDALGPPATVARLGPDYSGRYEQCFAAVRDYLLRAGALPSLRDLLHLRDPSRQAAETSPGTALGEAIDAALNEALALPNLVCLFGAGATANRLEPFCRHFARRLRWALDRFPALENVWLWQMLLGENPPGQAHPWLTLPPQPTRTRVSCFHGFMADALAAGHDWDFIHLSNILDWLTPEQATETLDCAFAALNPGGYVLIRQLNSTLDIPAAGPHFHWLPEADDWHNADRSFFYRQLHLGRKP